MGPQAITSTINKYIDYELLHVLSAVNKKINRNDVKNSINVINKSAATMSIRMPSIASIRITKRMPPRM